MRRINRLVNRQFGAIIYKEKPILVIPGGEMAEYNVTTKNFIAGLSRRDSKYSEKIEVLHGATFNHNNVNKSHIIEVTDNEIEELITDPKLSNNFIAVCYDLLNQEPVRPQNEW